ncbi:MAG: Do family serine endopeptidase [Candidatus Pelagibacter sp.]
MFKNLKVLILLITISAFTFQTKAETPSSFANLAEKLMPSVVNISTTQTVVTRQNQFPFEFPPGSPFEDMFKDFGTPEKRQAMALGSGFIINSNGTVITNNHVIKGADDILVRVGGDRDYKAEVLGADPLSDIAVLKIISEEKFIPVDFGDSDKSRIGDWVIAIGNPFGLGGTVTAGIISARNRDIGLSRYEDFIQTDASINQGNSGGPLFNMDGEVIGINTAILGQSGSIGIGFAIPSNSAEKVIDQLIKFGETKRGWLGVRIQVVSKEIAEAAKLNEPKGAFVASVADKSPSDKAGIKNGDIIINFNGTPINEMKELPKIVAQTEVGKVVEVIVWRNGKEIIKKIKLGRLETSDDFKVEKPNENKISEIEKLKISVRLVNQNDLRERNLPSNTKGLVITDIKPESPIDYLNVGNIIIETDGKPIRTVGQLNNYIDSVIRSGNKTIFITIYNNQNQKRSIGIKIE